MVDVITLDDHRPHVTLHAVCVGCGFDWQAVAPECCEAMLECPECGAMAGVEKDTDHYG